MLCFKHHSEFHNIGAKAFADKYHFHGIKLSDKSILSLRLMSQKQMDEFDEEYKRQKQQGMSKNDWKTLLLDQTSDGFLEESSRENVA